MPLRSSGRWIVHRAAGHWHTTEHQKSANQSEGLVRAHRSSDAWIVATSRPKPIAREARRSVSSASPALHESVEKQLGATAQQIPP
jgi:hypothetical protein